MTRIRPPEEDRVPPGPARDLVLALHELYSGTGYLSTRRIASAVDNGEYCDAVSHTTVAEMLHGTRTSAQWSKWDVVVRVLAVRNNPRRDPETEAQRMQELWDAAQHHAMSPSRRKNAGDYDRAPVEEPLLDGLADVPGQTGDAGGGAGTSASEPAASMATPGFPPAQRLARGTPAAAVLRELPVRHADGSGTWRRIAAAAAVAVTACTLLVMMTHHPGERAHPGPDLPRPATWIHKTAGGLTSVVMAHGTVYATVVIGSNKGMVYALNAATGDVRWTFPAEGNIFSRPAVANGALYVGSDDHDVYALDAATGRVRWVRATGGVVVSGPAVASGTVYVGSGDDKVYALDAATGHIRWVHATGGPVKSSPAVAGDTIYIGSGDHKVYALNAANGQLRWAFTTGNGILSSPLIAGGMVYIGSMDHNVYALSAATGRVRWSYQTGSWIFFSSPVLADGTIYIGSTNGEVYALYAGTGQPRWIRATGGKIQGSAAVSDGTVYIGSFDHKLYALDATTGRVKWTYTTGAVIGDSPVVADGTVYVGSSDGNVYALNAATGSLG
jgi:outer membrane protein assembly factor BamB